MGDRVREAFERWQAEVLKERAASVHTPPTDALDDERFLTRIGFPGAPPFTRGIHATMYRERLWTMRQYAGFGTAEESNRRFRYLLAKGQTGLSVAFDLPTQMGLDSDHPRSAGEVGRVGVAIDSVDDMERLFHEIPLDQVSTSMTINSTAPILLALYVAVGDRQGLPRRSLRGTVQNDLLKEYIARGTYIYPAGPSLRLFTDVLSFAVREVPNWNAVSVSGYHMREAGCTAAQEIAFTLGNAVAYVEAARARGMDFESFGGQISFFFAVQSNLLEEVAKFRAARRMWTDITERRFGARSARARSMRFHCQTAGATLTAQQPLNNVVRVAYQALAAVLGGAQSLHTNSYDEALALPSERSATLALRTQQILGYETGVADVVDPLGGSWALEAATDRLEEEARAYLTRVDGMGGMVAALEQGFVQREIQNAAYAEQLAVEDQSKVVVGVNRFQGDGDGAPDLLRLDPELERRQAERVRTLRAGRDAAAARKSLDAIARAAAGDENLMPLLVDAVQANVTLGEISDTLRDVFGTHQEIQTL